MLFIILFFVDWLAARAYWIACGSDAWGFFWR
jgi:hypothetical protein